MKCDVRLSHNGDAPSSIIYKGESADLVLLHQHTRPTSIPGHTSQECGHDIRNPDCISILPGSDHAAAQVSICHDPFKQGI